MKTESKFSIQFPCKLSCVKLSASEMPMRPLSFMKLKLASKRFSDLEIGIQGGSAKIPRKLPKVTEMKMSLFDRKISLNQPEYPPNK